MAIISLFWNTLLYWVIVGGEMNDVDSIDGSCVSSHIDVDYDTRSTSSEIELYQHTNIKPQKLETRIGIGHFNRYCSVLTAVILMKLVC